MIRSMYKMALLAAFASNMLNPIYNPGQSWKNNSVAYKPKRKKFKGWQRHARQK
jgi:hypothetical protein